MEKDISNGLKKTFVAFCLISVFILIGCQNVFVKKSVEIPKNEINNQQDTKIANPASTNCIEKGGTIEIRKNKKGEYGVCLFEDNRQCEEWALLRGNCPVGGVKISGYENDAQIFCAITGGEVHGLGTEAPMCKRIDGTLCNLWANLDGDCPDTNDPNPNAGNVEAQ